MKTLFNFCLLLLPLISMAKPSGTLSNQIKFQESNDPKNYLITSQNGITVYASPFSLEGASYVSLEFTNTTSEDLRVLWSAQVGSSDVVVNMDGTTQGYLTIPAGKSVYFGKTNSTDPLMEVSGDQLEKAITIHIEIQ
ncbi:MAG: hypothetical protein RLZ33_480 [Bacteroidota bacterium]